MEGSYELEAMGNFHTQSQDGKNAQESLRKIGFPSVSPRGGGFIFMGNEK